MFSLYASETIPIKKPLYRDFPGGPADKNSLCNARDLGSIPGWRTKMPPASGQLSQCFVARACMKSLCIATRACACVCAQSYLTLCDPMDCSLPDSSVHGIFQAGILERVAISSSFQTQGWNPSLLYLLLCLADSFPLAPPGKPLMKAQHNQNNSRIK